MTVMFKDTLLTAPCWGGESWLVFTVTLSDTLKFFRRWLMDIICLMRLLIAI
jgi:hypothetical protein